MVHSQVQLGQGVRAAASPHRHQFRPRVVVALLLSKPHTTSNTNSISSTTSSGKLLRQSSGKAQQELPVQVLWPTPCSNRQTHGVRVAQGRPLQQQEQQQRPSSSTNRTPRLISSTSSS
jgi:hypothetical protein